MIPRVVGNWKMHGSQTECAALATQISDQLRKQPSAAQVSVAPPFTALSTVKRTIDGGPVGLVAQNCHWEERGAFTGEISAPMLREIGCDSVILGHSERRHVFHEDDAMIARKVPAVLRASMEVILCVGEKLDERQSGQTFAVITRQLTVALKDLDKGGIEHLAIAYEPVWAIGTGQNATPAQVSEVHQYIRQLLLKLCGAMPGDAVPILYGGSVNPANSGELAQAVDVGGFLVGGASLKAETFLPIVHSFSKS
jgi:triosephosphate isomerase